MRRDDFLRNHRRLYKAKRRAGAAARRTGGGRLGNHSGVPVQAARQYSAVAGWSTCPALASNKAGRPYHPRPRRSAQPGSGGNLHDQRFRCGQPGRRKRSNKRKARQLRDAIEPIEDQIVAACFRRIAML